VRLSRVLSGGQGIALAHWLAEQGIDASLHAVNIQEQWVIVFNPAIIARYEQMPADRVTTDRHDLPLVAH